MGRGNKPKNECNQESGDEAQLTTVTVTASTISLCSALSDEATRTTVGDAETSPLTDDEERTETDANTPTESKGRKARKQKPKQDEKGQQTNKPKQPRAFYAPLPCEARNIASNVVFWLMFVCVCYVTMMFALNSARRFQPTETYAREDYSPEHLENRRSVDSSWHRKFQRHRDASEWD